MLKRHKIPLIGILAVIAIVIGGIGSYALAQSGSDTGTTAIQSDGPSRHIDYDVNLQVNGDLSAVNPKLQGLLPLDLSAKGGADVEKTANGPAVKGDLQLSGVDSIVQKLMAGNGSGGNSALGSSIVNGLLSNLQFVAVDKDLYVNVGGTWYDTGTLAGHKGHKPDGDGTDNNGAGNAQKDNAKAGIAGAFQSDPKAYLKDVKTVGQEDIDGTATTHYSGTVDLDKVLTDAATAATNAGKADEAAKLNAAKSQVTGAFKQLGVEWWIDGSNQLLQVKVAIDVNPSTLAPLVDQMAANKQAGPNGDKAKVNADAVLKGITSVTLNATVKFSHFNEDFQIAKPDGNVQPLKDLLGSFGFSGHNGANGDSWHGHKNGQGGNTDAAATTSE